MEDYYYQIHSYYAYERGCNSFSILFWLTGVLIPKDLNAAELVKFFEDLFAGAVMTTAECRELGSCPLFK